MKNSTLVAAAALIALAGCYGDETLTKYGAADAVWQLTQLDGQHVRAKASLRFPEPGKLAGQAPCNTYSGAQTAPYPWFKADQLVVTRRACPDLEAERAYFAALDAMTQVEVSGQTLILSNDDGRMMVFQAEDKPAGE